MHYFGFILLSQTPLCCMSGITYSTMTAGVALKIVLMTFNIAIFSPKKKKESKNMLMSDPDIHLADQLPDGAR